MNLVNMSELCLKNPDNGDGNDDGDDGDCDDEQGVKVTLLVRLVGEKEKVSELMEKVVCGQLIFFCLVSGNS